MKKLRYPWIKFLVLILAISSCGEEAFAPKRVSQSEVSNPVTVNSFNACSSFSMIKPKVDFLFLWDNSTSAKFIDNDTKAALNETINNISSRFDYHVLMAPLVVRPSDPLNFQASFMSENTQGLGASATSIRIDPTFAANALNFDYSQGSLEKGIDRAVELIKGNQGNGIFRANSYVFVILMSNQDDTSWAENKYPATNTDRDQYINAQAQELLCMRGSYTSTNCAFSLNSIQLRFINITAFNDFGNGNTCGKVTSWKKGSTYQIFSRKIYQEAYRNGGSLEYRQRDQEDRADGLYDSYNICDKSSYERVFDGINASINSILVEHKYNYWPVASSGSASIDPEEIRVFKDGTEYPKLSPAQASSGQSGFTFTNSVQTRNTRYAPTPGEPYTGYMVQLHGNARVTYPQCIRVQTQTPKEFFGYVNLQTKPIESSIQLKINGVTIPQSSTNGWQLLKSGGQPAYFDSKNVKITGPGNFCPSTSTNYCAATPAQSKSGYFLQLFGTAVYSNGDVIELLYDPST